MTNRVFISYSGHRAERRALWEALREHGLVPWRDVEDLPVGVEMQRDIEGEIAECSSVMIWLTEDIFGSKFVREVEVPAIQKAVAERDLLVVPVFDCLDIIEANDLAVTTWGFPLADYNGHKLDRCRAIEVECATIAGRLTRAVLARAAESGPTPIVRAVTRDDSAPHADDCTLNFDWRHAYSGGELPDWNIVNRLASALDTSLRHLKATFEPGQVLLALKTHLHVAVAIGHSFRRPTGFVPVMDVSGQTWIAEATTISSEVGVLSVATDHLDSCGGRSTVEVSLSREVGPGVDTLIAQHEVRYAARMKATPESGPDQNSLPDDATANAWARRIVGEMAALTDEKDVEGFDFFLSCPVEFAALFGWWLNAAGSIDIHHWTGNAGPYQRVWTLPSV